MCGKNCSVSAVIYFFLECIVLILVVLGTAFDQYRLKTSDGDLSTVEKVLNDGNCLTMWGPKQKCYSGGYSIDNIKSFWENCPPRQDRFRAAQGLAVISCIIIAVSVLFSLLFLCCCKCMRYVIFAINLLCIGTLCVVWAMMVDSYHNRRGSVLGVSVQENTLLSCLALKRMNYRFGTGFILLVVGWVLQFINTFIILLPC